MKVILVNGSPHPHGCTYTALDEVARTLQTEGIESEIFQVGTDPIIGCTACMGCRGTGRCVYDDCVNDFLDLAPSADGFVFGTPVHYAAASGAMTSFMDRAFYPSMGPEGPFYLKPAACVVSARRAGTTAAFDQMIKYLTISEMPVVSSSYWNMVHGFTPEQVRQDLEGLRTMRVLAHNMAWMLRNIEAGRAAGLPMPAREPWVMTNFIR